MGRNRLRYKISRPYSGESPVVGCCCGFDENQPFIILEHVIMFFIWQFRRVLNVAFFLLSDSPASEFYVLTFRNTLSIPSSCLHLPMNWWNWQSVPKRQHIKFRRRRLTEQKEYIRFLRVCHHWRSFVVESVDATWSNRAFHKSHHSARRAVF